MFCILAKVSVRSQDSLFDWTVNKLPLLSSYHCEANTTLNHFGGSVMDDLIQVSLSVSQLQVQAFRFNDDIKFDDCKLLCTACAGGVMIQ